MEKSGFNRFCDGLEKVTLFVVSFILAVMMLVCWAHVFCRYILNSALSWSEEFLRFALVWFTTLSASILHKRKGHLGITVFREMMPKKVQQVLEKSIMYVALVIQLFVTVIGFNLVSTSMTQLSPALRLSMAVPYAAIPVGFLLMAVYSIKHILDDLHSNGTIEQDQKEAEV